jgi:hypothetical protein
VVRSKVGGTTRLKARVAVRYGKQNTNQTKTLSLMSAARRKARKIGGGEDEEGGEGDVSMSNSDADSGEFPASSRLSSLVQALVTA